MNREIKFRQRNKNNGSFYYWGFVNGEWKQPIIQDNYHAPEESDQYIGLKDSTKWESLTSLEQAEWLNKGNLHEEWNGKEIYEGDIVKTNVTYLRKNWLVEWVYDKWEMTHPKDDYDNGDYYRGHEMDWSDVEVIGNLMENPELLEVNNG